MDYCFFTKKYIYILNHPVWWVMKIEKASMSMKFNSSPHYMDADGDQRDQPMFLWEIKTFGLKQRAHVMHKGEKR